MLRVDNIWAKGRHHALFGRTSFSVNQGEVIIIQADSQMERTSLGLALTGRLPLSGGEIFWSAGNGEPQPRAHRHDPTSHPSPQTSTV